MSRFDPGFCFSAVALDGATKVVVNVCGHDSVGGPLAKNMSPVAEDYIEQRGVDNLIIPISVSSPIELDKGAPYSYRIDVVVHTSLAKRCVREHHFFEHYVARLTELAVKWVKEECGMTLVPASCTYLGSFLWDKGSGKGKAGSPPDVLKATERMLRALEEAAESERRDSRVNGDLPDRPELPADLKVRTPSATLEKPGRSLVQEVVKNPGIKRGFLLSGNASLYDEGGSPEGEGKQPDSLAHIPKSIRDKCKIIDLRGVEKGTIQEAAHKEKAPEGGTRIATSAVPSATADVAPPFPEPHKSEPLWKLEAVSTFDDFAVIRVVTSQALKGASEVNLTVSGTDVDVDDFHYTFHRTVDDEKVKAKFVKSSRTLVLTCPFV